MSTPANDGALRALIDSMDPATLARLKALVDARTATPPPPPADGPATYRGIAVPEVLRPNWDTAEASWWKAGVRRTLDAVVPLLDDLANDEPCTLDHHGYCQMHSLPTEGPCPDGAARRLIAESRNPA